METVARPWKGRPGAPPGVPRAPPRAPPIPGDARGAPGCGTRCSGSAWTPWSHSSFAASVILGFCDVPKTCLGLKHSEQGPGLLQREDSEGNPLYIFGEAP